MTQHRSLPADFELSLYRDLTRTFRSFDLKTVSEEILNSLLHNVRADYATLLILSDNGWHVDRVFRAGFGFSIDVVGHHRVGARIDQ